MYPSISPLLHHSSPAWRLEAEASFRIFAKLGATNPPASVAQAWRYGSVVVA